MINYNEKSRLSIDELAKQFFLTKDVSTFHYVHLKKSKMAPDQSIIINSKKESYSYFKNICSFYEERIDISQIDPKETEDEIPFYQNNYPKNKIKDKPKDYIGMEIEKQKMDDIYKNEGVQEKINSSMSDYLHQYFDEMKKDCFYVEPLLIPTQPPNSYNFVDPIFQYIINH